MGSSIPSADSRRFSVELIDLVGISPLTPYASPCWTFIGLSDSLLSSLLIFYLHGVKSPADSCPYALDLPTGLFFVSAISARRYG